VHGHVLNASAVCAGPCCAGGVSVKFRVHSKGKHELQNAWGWGGDSPREEIKSIEL